MFEVETVLDIPVEVKQPEKLASIEDIHSSIYKEAKDAYFNGRFEDAQRYLNQAKGCLYGEMAIALDMDKEEVEDYITNRINN